MLLEGLQLPLTTPFYGDGRLNLRKLEQNVAAYSKTPAAGLAVLSENGEPRLLSDEQTRQVLRAAMGAAAAEKVMLAGTSRDSVLGTLDTADFAAEMGYDAAFVKQPICLGVGKGASRTRERITYFQTVADRSAIPLILFSTKDAPLPLEIVVELAGHPRIIGLIEGDAASDRMVALREATAAVKHEVTVTSIFTAVTGRMLARQGAASTGDMLSADKLTGAGAAVAEAPPAATVKTRTKTVGFQILAASTAQMLDALLAGAVGAMPPLGACVPQACYEVLAAWKDGDHSLAEQSQARLQA
ncbi:MAG: dihydrodipicolinate synthase family protein, partial [Edaphobacter sp.]